MGSTQGPVPGQPGTHPNGYRRIAVIDGEAQSGQDVVAFDVEPADPLRLFDAAHERLGLLDQVEKVRRVCTPHTGDLTALGESIHAELADRFEHPIAAFVGIGCLYQGFLRQRGQDVFGLEFVQSTYPGNAVRRCATREDAELLRDRAFGIAEQVPTPGDHGAQGLLARERGTTSAGEQPESVR
jgi:hypothetical protein